MALPVRHDLAAPDPLGGVSHLLQVVCAPRAFAVLASVVAELVLLGRTRLDDVFVAHPLDPLAVVVASLVPLADLISSFRAADYSTSSNRAHAVGPCSGVRVGPPIMVWIVSVIGLLALDVRSYRQRLPSVQAWDRTIRPRV
jgi:hypothetical protein